MHEFPLGFTLNGPVNPVSDSINSLPSKDSMQHLGFSMLDRLEETIKVSVTLRSGAGFVIFVILIGLTLTIKESKSTHVELWKLRQIWGNSEFDFVTSPARGMSGGIISLWNNRFNIRWINVYAPQNLSRKIDLWNSLLSLTASWDGVVVMMGDFNEVRNAGERHGSNFNDRHAKIFNNFIDGASLIDVPLGGYNFTWMDKWGSKMSKLDRFLVSNNFHDSFPHATRVVLEKGTPDHRAILLKELQVDYGPTPFKFFHSWLEIEGFKDLVEQTWKNDGIINDCKMTHQALLSSIEVKIDLGTANEDDFRIRKESLKILGDLERVELADVTPHQGGTVRCNVLINITQDDR
nr:hypothetical protein [Tanacetum cinerariifolium]